MLGALVAALATTATATAQDFRGAITGAVKDGSGGVLPGVTVTATNVATNVGSTTTTNGEGLFTIPYLTSGTYTVTAELSGFKKSVRERIEVRLGDRLEFLNAFNRAVFSNPNTDPTSAEFGKVTSQNNLPRDIQLAVKLLF